MSLVHVGSNDSFAITPEGRQAATLLNEALDAKTPEEAKAKAEASSKIYDEIVLRENYGSEYTALQWFDYYIAADDAKRASMLSNRYVKYFFDQFSADNYKLLREFLDRKYRIHDIGDEETRNGQDRKIWIEDTMLFENPRREEWEHTSVMLKLLDLKPGMRIADVGSGPGYYSFRFADAVGPTGKVYAIDMVEPHLQWVEREATALGVKNIQTIQTDGRTVGLAGAENQVDAVFVCSLYHNVYAMTTEPDREEFVNSIKAAIGRDGTFFLADNGLVPNGVLPYHGPYVAKELLIAQMLNFGFELVAQHQFIPQRYLLVLRNSPGQASVPAGALPAAPPSPKAG